MVLVPERDVVRVVVHVIGESLFRQQPPRVVGEQVAGQPSTGTFADGALDGLRGPADEGPLLLLVEAVLVHPAPAVAAHFVRSRRDPARELRRALETHGRRGERGRHAVAVEERHSPAAPPP